MASTFFFNLIQLTNDPHAITDVWTKFLPYAIPNTLKPDMDMVQMYVNTVRMERLIFHIERMIKTLGFYVEKKRKRRFMHDNFRSTVQQMMDRNAFDLMELFEKRWNTNEVSYVLGILHRYNVLTQYHWLIINLIRISIETRPKADMLVFRLYKRLQYIRADKPLAITALRRILDDIFSWLATSLRDDRDITLLAVKRGGDMLKYASARLRDDQEIVHIAVSEWPRSLKYASARLRNNKEIIQLALFADPYGISHLLRYASEHLQNDTETVSLAVTMDGDMLEYASATLRDTTSIVHLAIQSRSQALAHASDRLKDDFDTVVLAAQPNNGQGVLRYASLRLRNDPFFQGFGFEDMVIEDNDDVNESDLSQAFTSDSE
ncbi:MAG: DUF4116 domain-containing protein [Sphingobacteriaceae bacterium]|nr:MAG: DUF4116 domain-containing protein [Sphingobacteriaceae bacterium]